MYRFIMISRRVLRMLYQFGFIIMLFDFAVAMAEKPMMEVKWFIVTFVVLALSYVFRDMFNRVIFFLLTHLIMEAAIIFFVHPLVPKIFILIACGVFFVDGVRYILHQYMLQKMFDIPWGCVALGIVITLYGYFSKVPDLMKIGYTVPLIMILIYIISLYIEGLEDYLNSTKNESGVPIDQIVKVNTILISGIMCVALVVLGLSNLFGLHRALVEIGKNLVSVLRIVIIIAGIIQSFLFSFFSDGDNSRVNKKLQELQEETQENNLFDDIVWFMAVTATIIVVSIFVIKLFSFLIRLFLSRQDRRYEFSERINADIKPIKREKIIKKDRLAGNSPVMRARRIYRKKVLSFRKDFVPDGNDTTGDIKESMNKYKPENDSEELTKLYNAVRYGEKVPDRKYLESMKKA